MIPDLTKIKHYLLCFCRNLPQFKINSPNKSCYNMSLQSEFNDYRSRMNEVILSKDNLPLKRFFSLDHQMYQDGALPMKTKEMLGLVASMVLRCDDCIRYHLGKCHASLIHEEELNTGKNWYRNKNLYTFLFGSYYLDFHCMTTSIKKAQICTAQIQALSTKVSK